MQLIRFTTHLPNARIPARGLEHAASFDLRAELIECATANQQLIIDTGLKLAFDAGHVLLIYRRFGLSMKHGIRLSNRLTVINAVYRCPIKILLRLDKRSIIEMLETIAIGDRVAEPILTLVIASNWVAINDLDETDRGEGGFGSTSPTGWSVPYSWLPSCIRRKPAIHASRKSSLPTPRRSGACPLRASLRFTLSCARSRSAAKERPDRLGLYVKGRVSREVFRVRDQAQGAKRLLGAARNLPPISDWHSS